MLEFLGVNIFEIFGGEYFMFICILFISVEILK